MPNLTSTVTGFPQILSETPSVKAALRRRIRAERRRRTPAERLAQGRALAAIALELPEVQIARCVALYVSTPDRTADRPAATGAPQCRHRRRAAAGAPRRPGVGLGRRRLAAADAGAGRRRARRPDAGPPWPADGRPRPGARARRRHPRHPARPGRRVLRRLALPLLDAGVRVLAVVHDEELLDAAVEALPAEHHDVPVDGALTPLRCLRLPGRSRP